MNSARGGTSARQTLSVNSARGGNSASATTAGRRGSTAGAAVSVNQERGRPGKGGLGDDDGERLGGEMEMMSIGSVGHSSR